MTDALRMLKERGYNVLGHEPNAIEVVRYDNKLHRGLWEGFIRDSINGNLFHTRRFLDYHPEGRFMDHSLLFLKKGNMSSF